MLIKNDFDQIRKIVREEVESEAESTRNELGSKIIMSRIRVQEDIDGLKNRIKNLEIRVAKINKEEIDEEGDI